MSVEFLPVDDLVPYERNAKKHGDAQVAELIGSIKEWGWTNPILADEARIVAGHGRRLAAKLIYSRGERIRLPSGAVIPDRTVPVINCRGWSDDQRRAYILADNRIAENSAWDEKLLALEVGELRDLGFDTRLAGFDSSEFADGGGERRYSGMVDTPVYEPTSEEPPHLDELVDDERASALVARIEEAEGVPEEVRAFLRVAACRHVVFDYGAIAEYYCHAPPEVKALMEDSALVIIDIDDAIAKGYVRLTERLMEIYGDADGA